MRILGIHNAVDSGAALIEDGRVLAAVNEERLNRLKLTSGFPVQSIHHLLTITGTTVADIDLIAIDCRKGHHVRLDTPFRSPLRAAELDKISTRLVYSILPLLGKTKTSWELVRVLRALRTPIRTGQEAAFLRNRLGFKAPIKYYDHHYNHACSAYYTSGFRNALVITMDGGGEGYSSKIYAVRDGKVALLTTTSTYDSVGNLYAVVTALLGFTAHNHEGKITGLAAFGNPVYLDLMRKMFVCRHGRVRNLSDSFVYSTLAKLRRELPRDFKREDVAASVQMLLEEVATEYCRYWIVQSGLKDVALAGGVFANVKLNQRIHELDAVDHVFVHPGMGDGGLGLGACYAAHQEFGKSISNHELRIDNVYWGPCYSNEDIEARLRARGVNYSRVNGIENEVARLLAEGKVVARFSGRMEYGPRALGNRSILYQATDPSVNDWLNKRLARTEFMPFAPVTLKEHAGSCYKNIGGAEHTAQFMTITFDCYERMRKECPAVVHVDGTARPQLIDRESNPSYYDIVSEYHKRTGLASIINTSFNMHEEPIVCTPDDAIRSFQQGQLDYLAIGDFLVRNDAAPPAC